MTELQTILAHLRHAGIRIGLEALSLIPSSFQIGPWSGRGVIFTLHHVQPKPPHPFQPNALLSITPEFLDSAICVALECGLVPARLEDVPELLKQADSPRFFAVTLDDGYRDNAEFAAPVFRKHGIPYTIFATSGFVDRSRSPWWELAERILQHTDQFRFDFGDGLRAHDAATLARKSVLFARFAAHVNSNDEDAAVQQIEALALESGIDPSMLVRELVMDAGELRDLATSDGLVSIGAHTLTHPNLARVSASRLKDEVEGSIAAVQAIVGRRPQTFAYPYGWASAAREREAQAAAEAGLAVAVTTRPGVLKPASSLNTHLLPRISLNGHYQEARFVRALISGLPFIFR